MLGFSNEILVHLILEMTHALDGEKWYDESYVCQFNTFVVDEKTSEIHSICNEGRIRFKIEWFNTFYQFSTVLASAKIVLSLSIKFTFQCSLKKLDMK